MSIFDLSDFERQGKIETDVKITNSEELKNAFSQISGDAMRSIQIYTPDLEPGIYNDETFVDNLLAMSRGNRHAQIQILVMDPSSAIHRGHLLLRLAQQLTSSVEIRIPSEEYREDNISFILVDQKAFIYRPDTKYISATYNSDCKIRAQKLSEIFSLAWEHAEQDPQTRRLSI